MIFVNALSCDLHLVAVVEGLAQPRVSARPKTATLLVWLDRDTPRTSDTHTDPICFLSPQTSNSAYWAFSPLSLGSLNC